MKMVYVANQRANTFFEQNPCDMPNKNRQKYWKKNLQLLSILLFIWFLVSYGCGILFVDALNQFHLGGFKLGFWFAQQGSIYVFIILIFIYIFQMNKLDEEFGVQEE